MQCGQVNRTNVSLLVLAIEMSSGGVAWGNQTMIAGAADWLPFGFAGGLADPDTGLVRFGARDFDPHVGRWTAKDPNLFAGGSTNLYEYCGGDPIDHIDPSGLVYGQTALDIADGLMLGSTAMLAVATGGWLGGAAVFGGTAAGAWAGIEAAAAGAWAWAISPAGIAAGTAAVGAVSAPGAPTAIVPYYPANNGFAGGTTSTLLGVGSIIDRYGGSAASRFFSPAGTPLAARALPPDTAAMALRSFEVLRPIEAESGLIAPAFGQLGYGTQFRTAMTLEELLHGGYLREIGP
jgi:RHS repeat-associated protein